MSGVPAAIAVLVAAVAAAGCGGGAAAEPSSPARRPAAAADLRAPDRLGRLQAVSGARAFACTTNGVLGVRFAGRDGVTVTGDGPPLAFGRAGVRLVRRDCPQPRR